MTNYRYYPVNPPPTHSGYCTKGHQLLIFETINALPHVQHFQRATLPILQTYMRALTNGNLLIAIRVMFVHVHFHEGQDLPRYGGKCNPSCKIWIDSRPTMVVKVRALHKTRNPVWNQTVTIPITGSGNEMLLIKVLHRRLGGHKSTLGRTSIPIAGLPVGAVDRSWHDLSYGGKIKLNIQITSNHMPAVVATGVTCWGQREQLAQVATEYAPPPGQPEYGDEQAQYGNYGENGGYGGVDY